MLILLTLVAVKFVSSANNQGLVLFRQWDKSLKYSIIKWVVHDPKIDEWIHSVGIFGCDWWDMIVYSDKAGP